MGYFANELQGLSNYNFSGQGAPTQYSMGSAPQGGQALQNYMYGMSPESGITPQVADNSFGFNTNTLGAVTGGLQSLGGLASAYMGYKNYKMAKDQFGFQKGLANRNLANQAKTINNAYSNAAQVAAGMVGGRDTAGKYGLTDQALVDKYAAKAKEQYVDGSPIK